MTPKDSGGVEELEIVHVGYGEQIGTLAVVVPACCTESKGNKCMEEPKERRKWMEEQRKYRSEGNGWRSKGNTGAKEMDGGAKKIQEQKKWMEEQRKWMEEQRKWMEEQRKYRSKGNGWRSKANTWIAGQIIATHGREAVQAVAEDGGGGVGEQ
jgi:hypothetical protein